MRDHKIYLKDILAAVESPSHLSEMPHEKILHANKPLSRTRKKAR